MNPAPAVEAGSGNTVVGVVADGNWSGVACHQDRVAEAQH